MVASDCPSVKVTMVEVVVKTAESDGVICQVAVTSPIRPADLKILQFQKHQVSISIHSRSLGTIIGT